MKTVECDWCGDKITRHPSRFPGERTFCSMECKGRWQSKENRGEAHPKYTERAVIECDWCGDEFERLPRKINDGYNFCSRDCLHQWSSESNQGSAHPDHVEFVTVDCAWCGETLERAPHRIENYDRQFCDSECRSAWMSEYYRGEANAQYNRVTVNCDWCGSELKRQPSAAERSDHHFCDQECKGNWWSDNVRGKDHPNWDGGYSQLYGDNYHIQRRAALARDQYRCALCRLPRSQVKTIYGEDLNAHHIVRKEKFDTLEDANDLGNLLMVCRKCHQVFH